MWEFVYRILFNDGTIRIVGDEYLAALCKEKADRIARIYRIEVERSDWREVTHVTMRRILEGIEARNGRT